jgi:hypothetical protein
MMNNTGPVAPTNTVNVGAVPELLRSIPRWILWKAGEAKPNGKFAKFPTDPLTGKAHDAFDRNIWRSFDDACKLASTGRFSGVGYVLDGEPLSHSEDGTPLYLIELDIDAKSALMTGGGAEAKRVWLKLGKPYVEISPSGSGLRIFTLSRTKLRSGNLAGNELYSENRFLTVTGAGGKGTLKDCTEPLIELHHEWFPSSAKDDTPFRPNILQHLLEHPAPPETPQNIARAKSMLAHISADCDRDTWRDIIWSLESTGWQCREDLERDWSLTAPMRFTEEGLQSVRRSFNPSAPNGVKFGTLVFHAEKAGWSATAQSVATVEAPSAGDVLNGQVFAKLLENQMLYVFSTGKWLRWIDEGAEARWTWCDSGEEIQAAKIAVRHLLDTAMKEISTNPSDSKAVKQLHEARRAHDINKLQAMLKCAASEPGMGIASSSQLDSEPFLVGCRNGVVNLRTGDLNAPQPQQLITKQCSAAYTPDAPCPTWLRFLTDIFQADAATIDYLQRALGYTLTGCVDEEVLHFCFGKGLNGKSVFANVLAHIFGDYCVTAPADLLMRTNRESGNTDIARLCGARLVLANETRSDQRIDDLVLKTLVSRERITARFLYQNSFEFWPTFKLWVRGNHKPIVTDDSDGAWRRLRLVPFEYQIPSC